MNKSALPKSRKTPLSPKNFEYETVNRLIMVGNGFDLAHGLKSSLKDFITDYVKSILKTVQDEGKYDDILVDIGLEANYASYPMLASGLTDENCINKLLNLNSTRPFSPKWKSRLLESIIHDLTIKDWVDIEVMYFDFLAMAVEGRDTKAVKKLNLEIDYIRDLLIEYLQRETSVLNFSPHPILLSQFCSMIEKEEVLINTIEKRQLPSSFYFLNFNYTEILETYAQELGSSLSTINYIHGRLDSSKSNGQAPIFGYGDELDKKYKLFEDVRDDSQFEHIKSFKYLESNNYRNLIEFLESNSFQVHIFGHSCGLSDRTLLNEIFENDNCISVKVYYYENDGKNDFTKKNYSISKHFTSKTMLRNKVVNFKYCEPMFQPVEKTE